MPRYAVVALFVWLGTFVAPTTVQADPCGMVPPMYVGPGDPIKRVGPQRTYVFFKDGVESFVIRPGFVGKVDNFGMLIPFPSPPALRKMPDNIFSHITAAIDPPVITVYGRYPPPMPKSVAFRSAPTKVAVAEGLSVSSVRVIRQEAVGMYQVAVLEAGSPKALQGWMTRHGYKYPKGMDKVTAEYIKARWCFVAVKTRVSGKSGISPRPGMRKTKAAFPKGGSFSGKVQAMGFRFKTKKLVVPMRLSAYNKGRLRNIVYILTDGPKRIRHIPKTFVVRQISGTALHQNVTDLLPMRIINGTLKDIHASRWPRIHSRRNPVPHNGLARNLFASDLLAVRSGKLALDHENEKKMLLRIGERLNLRGKAIDRLNRQVLQDKILETVTKGLKDLKKMTMTIIDGDFPREVLARENLTFAAYQMPTKKNSPSRYNARTMRGYFLKNANRPKAPLSKKFREKFLGHHKRKKQAPTSRPRKLTSKEIYALLSQLQDPKKVSGAIEKLVSIGSRVLPYLFGEAVEGGSFVRRGWSIVGLAKLGGKKVDARLKAIHNDRKQHQLVRIWSAAGRLLQHNTVKTIRKTFMGFGDLMHHQAMRRPIRKRVMTALSKQKRKNVGMLILLSSWFPSMRATLMPQIIQQPPRALVKVMLTGSNNTIRRQAAAYLATLGQRKPKAVARALLAALRFRKGARKTPWHGGALFVPGMRWSRAQARNLVEDLLSWLLWAELRSKANPKTKGSMRQSQTQIHNNIRSLSLARVAGYRSPGWSYAGLDRWLLIWKRAVGCWRFDRILRQQRVLHMPRFKSLKQRAGCWP